MQEKIYKKEIRATLHRSSGKSSELLWTRFFNKVTTALSRGVELAVLTGQPGDVLEISSSNFGYLIATVRLTVNTKGLSSIKIEFQVDEK